MLGGLQIPKENPERLYKIHIPQNRTRCMTYTNNVEWSPVMNSFQYQRGNLYREPQRGSDTIKRRQNQPKCIGDSKINPHEAIPKQNLYEAIPKQNLLEAVRLSCYRAIAPS